MIYFALSLYLCWRPIGCQWMIVEHFASEAECLEAGKQYTVDSDSEPAGITDYKCIVKIRHPTQDRG
jgi:hypothetical protein